MRFTQLTLSEPISLVLDALGNAIKPDFFHLRKTIDDTKLETRARVYISKALISFVFLLCARYYQLSKKQTKTKKKHPYRTRKYEDKCACIHTCQSDFRQITTSYTGLFFLYYVRIDPTLRENSASIFVKIPNTVP